MTAVAHTDTLVKSTTCYECDANCLFDVTIDASGRAIKVEGLPNCPRGQLQLERQYHPDRLLYPLKRVGAKGSGEFERISWRKRSTPSPPACSKPKPHTAHPLSVSSPDTPRKPARNCNASRTLSAAPITSPNPAAVFGNDGGGKTHLRLQAQNHLHG